MANEVAGEVMTNSRRTIMTTRASTAVKENPSSAAEYAASLLGSPPSGNSQHISISSTREVQYERTMEVVMIQLDDARVDPHTSIAWAENNAGGSMH